jgi:hypothetical protein
VFTDQSDVGSEAGGILVRLWIPGKPPQLERRLRLESLFWRDGREPRFGIRALTKNEEFTGEKDGERRSEEP